MPPRLWCASLAALQKRTEGGKRVQHPPERVILVCEECGERMVLADPLSVWLSEGSGTVFECECGQGVTLASRLPDEESETLRGRTRSA